MSKLKKKSRKKKYVIPLIVAGAVLLLAAVGTVLYLRSLPAYHHTIVVENRVKTIRSDSTDPATVLKEAKISLGEQDRMQTVTTEKGIKITIDRAYTITVTVQEESQTAYSFGETVGQLLQRLEVKTGEDWRVSHSMDEQVYDGMKIQLDRVETATTSVIRDLDYGTRYCYDPTMAEGEEELLFYGIYGSQETFTDTLYVNGEVVSMTVKENVPVTEPVAQIVAVGTGEKVGQPRQYPLVGDDFLVTADHKCLFYSSVDVFQATGYSSWIDDVGDITACGTKARVGAVAVDPKVIPYFTKMYIVSKDGVYDYGEASAEDCGGAIKGKIIDLFFNTESECWQFGRRDILVYFLTEGQVGEPAI